MTDHESRLARLETSIDYLSSAINEYHNDLKKHMDEESVWVNKMMSRQDRIIGIGAGLMLAMSAVWAIMSKIL